MKRLPLLLLLSFSFANNVPLDSLNICHPLSTHQTILFSQEFCQTRKQNGDDLAFTFMPLDAKVSKQIYSLEKEVKIQRIFPDLDINILLSTGESHVIQKDLLERMAVETFQIGIDATRSAMKLVIEKYAKRDKNYEPKGEDILRYDRNGWKYGESLKSIE